MKKQWRLILIGCLFLLVIFIIVEEIIKPNDKTQQSKMSEKPVITEARTIFGGEGVKMRYQILIVEN